jgi:hypothetical protein
MKNHDFTSKQCVAESNRIEGIHRPPTVAEILEFDRFMALPHVTLDDLKQFVHVYQRGAQLRDRPGPGMNVVIGRHRPPLGGPEIQTELAVLLERCNFGDISAFEAHVEYENLHPFTDGNGRSGRMLWYWMMRNSAAWKIGFLHRFYYQTLDASRPYRHSNER